MKSTKYCDRSCPPIGWSGRWRRLRGYAAVLVAMVAVAAVARLGAQQTPHGDQQESIGSNNEGAAPPVSASPQAVPGSESKASNSDAVKTERKTQIADESAVLLKLASDLKAEVDKTTKDTLSLNVIRKADQIEKLAHSVKEQMKPVAGQN